MHTVCCYSCLFVAVLLLFVAVCKDCVNDMYYVFVLVVGPSWLFRGAATRHFPAGMCAVHVYGSFIRDQPVLIGFGMVLDRCRR